MPIVGGLDIHRKQLTFDYLDTVTGEVKRGQIAPADREHLRAWLVRFAGRDDVAFAVEGCTGWRYVAEELAAAGIAAHVGEPADTAAARGRKRHAKTDKTDSAHLRRLLAEGRLPECWVPPAQILEYRALLETYHDLRREHTAWVQRIHAVFFHQGAPALGEGALRTEASLAVLREAAAAHLSPGGQLQVATALDMLAALPVSGDDARWFGLGIAARELFCLGVTRHVRAEVAVHQVGDRARLALDGRNRPPRPRLAGHQPQLPHQGTDQFRAGRHAPAGQLPPDPPVPVRAIGILERPGDQQLESFPSSSRGAFRAGPPLIESGF
jgi:hypothetical protein